MQINNTHSNWPNMQNLKQTKNHKVIELGGILVSILFQTSKLLVSKHICLDTQRQYFSEESPRHRLRDTTWTPFSQQHNVKIGMIITDRTPVPVSKRLLQGSPRKAALDQTPQKWERKGKGSKIKRITLLTLKRRKRISKLHFTLHFTLHWSPWLDHFLQGLPKWEF